MLFAAPLGALRPALPTTAPAAPRTSGSPRPERRNGEEGGEETELDLRNRVQAVVVAYESGLMNR
jgi:hypothetical protein